MEDGTVLSGRVVETSMETSNDYPATVNVAFVPEFKDRKKVSVVMSIRMDAPTRLEEIIVLRDSLGIPKNALFRDNIGGVSFSWEAYV